MTSARRPLLYIDLLGFSEFILTHDLSSAHEFYRKLLLNADGFKSFIDRIDRRLRIDILSDSMFIWFDDAGGDLALGMLLHAGCVISHNLLLGLKQPIRGALVYDQFHIGQTDLKIDGEAPVTIQNFTLLGRAIVKAARWEKMQKWSGISIHPEDLEEISARYKDVVQNAVRSNHLMKHSVWTEKSRVETMVLNPVVQKNHGPILAGIFQQQVRESTNDKDRVKLERTLEIIEMVIREDRAVVGFPDWLRKLFPASLESEK